MSIAEQLCEKIEAKNTGDYWADVARSGAQEIISNSPELAALEAERDRLLGHLKFNADFAVSGIHFPGGTMVYLGRGSSGYIVLTNDGRLCPDGQLRGGNSGQGESYWDDFDAALAAAEGYKAP